VCGRNGGSHPPGYVMINVRPDLLTLSRSFFKRGSTEFQTLSGGRNLKLMQYIDGYISRKGVTWNTEKEILSKFSLTKPNDVIVNWNLLAKMKIKFIVISVGKDNEMGRACSTNGGDEECI
jgi:hypothetical protein